LNSSSDNLFGNELAQLLMKKLEPFHQRPLYLALSGGMDSMLMLYTLSHVLSHVPELKYRLTAIHINHGLSHNADIWQQQCQQACDVLAVPLIARRVVIDINGRGLEAAARQSRYDVFDSVLPNKAVLLMAHHASDQAETFMLRLLRGSGLAGLGAMQERRALTHDAKDERVLLRPWLTLTREVLATRARAEGITWVDDESNQDQRFDRNWVRHRILPSLKERHPAIETRLTMTTERLQSDYRLLQQLLEPFVEAVILPCKWPLTGAYALSLTELQRHPYALQEHLVRHWLLLNECAMPEGDKVWHWLQQCFNAADDKMPECAYGEVTLRRYRQHVYVVFSIANKQLPEHIRLPLVEPVAWLGGVIVLEDDNANSSAVHSSSFDLSQGMEFKASGLSECSLLPAGQCSGMKVRFNGRPSRTLKNIWQEQGIPPWLREHWPSLVIDSDTIIPIGLVNSCSLNLLKCEPIELLSLKWQPCAIGRCLTQ
jgi:tRNA(Ile)-lysidine synthase